ncbi:hypothetical protein [Bacillus pumilus]|uniref:hypothetical protein n=1 Tax=Bacillus pumilus TaxID=1408 RepID=UPI00119FBBC4|nr:hypothetical protein [Bacillus pumilus]
MSNKWKKGYKEVKNTIHNDIGLTKDEILDVIKGIVREEVANTIEKNHDFIQSCLRGVIREQIWDSLNHNKYKRGFDFDINNTFREYMTKLIKDEVFKELKENFVIDIDVKGKDKSLDS